MRLISLIVSAALIPMLGCSGGYQPAPPAPPKPAQPQAAASTTSTQPAPQPAQQSGLTGGMRAAGNAAGLAPLDMMNGPSGVPPASAGQSSPPPQPAPTYTPAAPGMGVKGQDYGGGVVMKPITTPIQAYFRAQDRIDLAQIKHQLDLYKALHDDKGPKTTEEFMQEIVKPLGVRLPELPPGERYVYDPATEQLMVEHPPK